MTPIHMSHKDKQKRKKELSSQINHDRSTKYKQK